MTNAAAPPARPHVRPIVAFAHVAILVAVVAAFYLTGAIPFDVEHVAFQFVVWTGGVALLRFWQAKQQA
jgi:hypothetical protein